ncbi:hypothetical protein UFOVP1516_8 [uncultured Caudovirales phage]|uniref:Uncharacterized protein n=1 Tax=uncultured Caudovirales phage TaxID=2100421 RepID=A0A6J5PHT8_9CAUD|nr:hypothetical protein UFOVP887_36 [uncultured Caudovirales phage]CAB5226687.1 hypothetical protein UFOVP1516_8 [uncultured Caudovirales phage]
MKIIQRLKLKLIFKWCPEFGITPVVLEVKGKNTYIKHTDGSLWKIGGKTKVV